MSSDITKKFPQVITRRDQLQNKADAKEAANEGRGRGRGGGRGGRGRGRGNDAAASSSRRGKRAAEEEEPEPTKPKKNKGRKSDQPVEEQDEAEQPPEEAEEVPADSKVGRRKKSKAVKTAVGDGEEEVEKPPKKPKKAAPIAVADFAERKVARIMNFVDQIDRDTWENMEDLKAEILSNLPEWEKARLNIYWTKGTCGVQVRAGKKSTWQNVKGATFTFAKDEGSLPLKQCVTCGCAKLLATHLNFVHF